NTNDAFSVDYVIKDGTATQYLDYYTMAGTNGTLTFAPGQISNSFSLYILDDNLVEGPETINLSLINPTGGAVVGAQGTAVLIIQDNDASIAFSSTNYIAAEKSTNAVITLIRRGSTTGEVSVVFSTSNLTAIAGQDYVFTSNVVKWAVGDITPKTVLVPLIDDSIVEGSEQVALILSNPTGGVMIETNFATLTIVDDAGVIAFSSQTYRVNESQGYAAINLLRTGGSNGVVSVDYSAIGGTATSGVDYANASGTVVFANGEIIKSILIPVFDDGIIEGAETVLLSLTNAQGGALIGSPSQATLTIYDSQLGIIDPAGTVLIAESLTPTNNIIDPNETVTISFGLRNSGFVSTTNLVATLLPGNGITNIKTNTQIYGVLPPVGAVVYKPFTFTASGTNGSIITAKLQLTDNGINLGIVNFSLIIGKVPNQFFNATTIVINDNTNATPYPSTINVSGVIGVVNKVTVTLNGLNHNYPSDIDILLVSPDGKSSVLMSDAGSGYSLNNVTLTFDGDATTVLPENSQITNGVYKPTNYLAADVFPPTAPSGPYTCDLSVFKGINPNGYWHLYVVDDDRGDSGVISGGWSLTLVTTEGVLPTPDLSVSATVSSDILVVGGELTYTISVTNKSSVVANEVIVNNQLPEGVALVSVSNPYGQFTTNMNLVTALIGTMQPGANAVITIKARIVVPQSVFVNWVSVGSTEPDSNMADNSVIIQTAGNINPNDLVMQFTKGSNKNLLLNWPALPGEWVIEAATELNGVWTPLTNTPAINGNNYQITVPIDLTGNKFYRVRKK
ncbi:MAG TPA: Calx-beta domain-containing protein, partial [Verrucomicrobiota bacterium]|nr:Calx-beta domain-containing protein [Verrucomicrobiota bacterium]